MNCPECGKDSLMVTDTRPVPDNMIRRRRECLNCGKRFTTYEWIPHVVRKKTRYTIAMERGGTK